MFRLLLRCRRCLRRPQLIHRARRPRRYSLGNRCASSTQPLAALRAKGRISRNFSVAGGAEHKDSGVSNGESVSVSLGIRTADAIIGNWAHSASQPNPYRNELPLRYSDLIADS